MGLESTRLVSLSKAPTLGIAPGPQPAKLGMERSHAVSLPVHPPFALSWPDSERVPWPASRWTGGKHSLPPVTSRLCSSKSQLCTARGNFAAGDEPNVHSPRPFRTRRHAGMPALPGKVVATHIRALSALCIVTSQAFRPWHLTIRWARLLPPWRQGSVSSRRCHETSWHTSHRVRSRYDRH